MRLTDDNPDGRSGWITDGYLRAVDPERSLRDAGGAIARPFHPLTAGSRCRRASRWKDLSELVPRPTWSPPGGARGSTCCRSPAVLRGPARSRPWPATGPPGARRFLPPPGGGIMDA